MSEENNTIIKEEPSVEAQPSLEAYGSCLDKHAQDLDEIRVRREELVSKAREVIDVYGINKEFFNDSARSLFFTSLLACQGHEDARFVNNALYLLTRKYSLKDKTELPVAQGSEIDESMFSDDYYEELYEAYTDQELSQRLSEKINQMGIFDEVKERLGLSDETTSPVNVRVLSIDKPFTNKLFVDNQEGLDSHDLQQWVKGLTQRADEFAKQHPQGDLAIASSGFATEVNGRKYIFVPMSTAEVFLAEDNGIELTEEGRQRIEDAKSTLKHEFVHTQKDLWIEGNFGRSLEERRAEYFSGDKREYYDVKRFFTLMYLAKGGRKITELLDGEVELRKQDSNLGAYELLVEQFGLDLAAKIIASQPNVYAHYSRSPALKEMIAGMGSYDEIISEVARNLSGGEKEAASERLRQFLERVQASPDFLRDYTAPVAEEIK